MDRFQMSKESTEIENETDAEGESGAAEREVETETVPGNREAQDRVNPNERDLLAGQTYEKYYDGISIEDIKQKINYLNKVRQQANEVKLLRFVTGRGGKKPDGNASGLVQNRPDLEDLFQVGSLSNPDEKTRYMTDVSAAHDLIEYLAAEAEQAIKQKERLDKEGEKHTEKPERKNLPKDTADNPGDVPEAVKEGKGRTEQGPENTDEESGDTESDDTTEKPDPGDLDDLVDDVPESVREGKGKEDDPEDGPDESKEESEESPETEDGSEEGPESQEENEETPDIPDPEDLQEEPQELKEARVKFLKAQRIHTSILRGETVQKLLTSWIPGVDRRSVMHEGEELFFDGDNDERNLRILKNNYAEKLEADKGEKIGNFVANELEGLPEGQKEQAITEFAQNLQAAQQQNQNEAFQALDESFDDNSFRDFWRRDDVWWARMGLSGAGLTASLAGAAVSGPGYMTARTAVGTASGYTMAEGYLEQTDNSLLDWISRRGAVSDIASGLDDAAGSEDIRNAIEERFGVEYANEDNQNAELKRELNRMRMLANELGRSVDEAVAGGNEMTARIVQEMQNMERDLVADTAVESIRGNEEGFGNLEDEAVHQGMMDSFSANESFMMSRMVEEGAQERVRKMQRKLGGALAGAGMGWLIGSGRMGRWLREGAEKVGDAWEGGKDWFWPGGAETTPAEPGPGMGELPPEMQPEPDADTIFEVEVTDWGGQEVYGDESQARSFIEATGDIKDQMQNLDAFDVTGGDGMPLANLEAAKNLQEFLDGDIANNLAERLDGYRPEDIRESLVVHSGETLSANKEGNLILEQAGGDTEVLYNGAQDQINTDTLKDDLFKSFDDVSGPEAAGQSSGLPGGDLPDADKVDAAGFSSAGDIDVPDEVNGGLEDQLSQTVVANNPDQANGVMKGAIHSYTKSLADADYNPEYLSDLSLPDGMAQEAFTDHIESLDQQEKLLDTIPSIAQNNPEQIRALNALFDSYAEANLTPPGVDISDTQELEALYESVDNYLDSKTPQVSVGEAGADTVPEPPSDEVGAQIEGEGRGASVTGESADKEVVGEGRGAHTESSSEVETEGEGQTPNQEGKSADLGLDASFENGGGSIQDMPDGVNTDLEIWDAMHSENASEGMILDKDGDLYVRTSADSQELQTAIDKARSRAIGDFAEVLNIQEDELPGELRFVERSVSEGGGQYSSDVVMELDLPDGESVSDVQPEPGDAGGQSGTQAPGQEMATQDQGGGDIEVNTGEDALAENNPDLTPQDRVAAEGIELTDFSASEVNEIEPVSGMNAKEYLGQSLLPNVATSDLAESYPPLQDVSQDTWIDLVDTFKESESFSDGIDQIMQLSEQEKKHQLEALFETLQADGGSDYWGTRQSPDGESLKVLQSYISDQYETLSGGQSLPDAISNR